MSRTTGSSESQSSIGPSAPRAARSSRRSLRAVRRSSRARCFLAFTSRRCRFPALSGMPTCYAKRGYTGAGFPRRFAKRQGIQGHSSAPTEREMPGIGSGKRLTPPGPAERVDDGRLIQHRLGHINGRTELMGGCARRGARARAPAGAAADALACRRLSPARAVTLDDVDAATREALGVPERSKRERLEPHAGDRAQRRALRTGIVGNDDAGIVQRETPDQHEGAGHGRRDGDPGEGRAAHEPIMQPGASGGDEAVDPAAPLSSERAPGPLHGGWGGR